jgi:uncharacterized 2Fe-2S/4Fe-4S cluster protein (DUF4445 family)
MPTLSIKTETNERDLPFTPGPSLREILATGGVPIRSGCGGMGVCGLCRVRINVGDAPAATGNELRMVRPEEIEQGTRLACQVRPCQNLVLTIMPPPLLATWSRIDNDPVRSVPPHSWRAVDDSTTPLGLAVDLGTTHLRLSLWDICRGKRLTGRCGPNPQQQFGSDVMTRLMAACVSKERATEIGNLARAAIGEALHDIATRDGYRLSEIGRVVIVGNSAMLTLLTEQNFDLLLKPAFWTSAIECRPTETASWCSAWGIAPQARVETVQPLAGFVGSDLLAGVVATGMTEQPGKALLIDFGTNSEIALWDGTELWVTSAAGGPAFEGSGIGCGMPAEPGAIWRITADDRTHGFHCEVIGGGEARGICGSGLVDMITCLRQSGRLSLLGRFTLEGGDNLPLLKGRSDLVVRPRDVDLFQRAKAAIGAGTKSLLNMAGVSPGDLRRIFVCGAFGRFLDVHNAQEIGLLPEVPIDRVELFGNSALAGCEQLLFTPDSEAPMRALKEKARIINLAQDPEFEELFIEQLLIRPMQVG